MVKVNRTHYVTKDGQVKKNPKKKLIFSSKDLSLITRRTNYNNHGENFEFIAKKIKSPLHKYFVKINEEHNQTGYLTSDLNKRRYDLYQRLMAELQMKSPEDYHNVYGRL